MTATEASVHPSDGKVRFGPVQGPFFPNAEPDFWSGSPPSPEHRTGPSVQAQKVPNTEPDLNRTDNHTFFSVHTSYLDSTGQSEYTKILSACT